MCICVCVFVYFGVLIRFFLFCVFKVGNANMYRTLNYNLETWKNSN